MQEKHWLIVYDIRNTKRLTKVAKCIESFAYRVQKSVFETKATDKTISHLKNHVEKIMNLDEDFILFFEICERDWQKKEIYGKTGRTVDFANKDGGFLIL